MPDRRSGDGLVPRAKVAWIQLRDLLLKGGQPAVMTSGWRSHSKQSALYADYLAGRSKYPVAKPGTSKHEKGEAFDIWTTPAGFTLALNYAPLIGLKSGMSYGDPVHFEVVGA